MKKVKEYLVELSLIVFGVFIAITVDDYRERSKTEAMMKSYLKVVKSDLAENMRLLDEEMFHDSIALNRISLLRSRITERAYDGLDSLTLYLVEHSSFTINDTGFRMIIQSGSSHTIETSQLARMTDLFGATMTDLNFYQEADYGNVERAMAFFTRHYPHVTERIRKPASPMSDEIMHVMMPRIISMDLELRQKKKLREKMVEVISFIERES